MKIYQNNINNYKDNNLILSIQEAERQRIARDLHDTTLQDLTHIVHQLELVGLYMDTDLLKANMELISIKSSIKSVMEEIRNIIFNLRPMTFDDLGFKETMDTFFVNLKTQTDMEIITDIDDIFLEDKIVLLNIYRVVVECIMNAVKYSHGTKIIFECKNRNQQCNIKIQDNGVGFDQDDIVMKINHFGLSVVKERIEIVNGKLIINSDKEKGTSILIEIPL